MTERRIRKCRDRASPQLETFERPKISQQIADARDKGDLF